MKPQVISEGKRVFKFGDTTLDDTNPNASPSQVLEQYSTVYPELTNASLEGPKIVKNELHYEFVTKLGKNG